jgi:hypothetical protein
MMESKDRIDLALRAALIAKQILDLTRPVSKTSAWLIMNEARKMTIDLAEKIKTLPED